VDDAEMDAYVLQCEKGAAQRWDDVWGSARADAPCCAALVSHPAAGAKTGEKRLRQFLCATPEWGDADERGAAAERAEARGKPDLAAALRAHNGAALRKRHFFVLCNDWGLRSDVWQRGRRRKLEDVPALQLLLAASAPDAAALLHEPSVTFRRHVISPALLQAVAAEPCAPVCTIDLPVRLCVCAAAHQRCCLQRVLSVSAVRPRRCAARWRARAASTARCCRKRRWCAPHLRRYWPSGTATCLSFI
jgi:hypothetical protein